MCSINESYSHNPYFNRWFSAIEKRRKKGKRSLIVTILILIDGFLQFIICITEKGVYKVTILILIDGFLQFIKLHLKLSDLNVTILILIDGFLQLTAVQLYCVLQPCHNPYFNRWFSAIKTDKTVKKTIVASQSLF